MILPIEFDLFATVIGCTPMSYTGFRPCPAGAVFLLQLFWAEISLNSNRTRFLITFPFLVFVLITGEPTSCTFPALHDAVTMCLLRWL